MPLHPAAFNLSGLGAKLKIESIVVRLNSLDLRDIESLNCSRYTLNTPYVIYFDGKHVDYLKILLFLRIMLEFEYFYSW